MAFYNEEQDHSPLHLKFFLLIFAKDKAQAQAQAQEGQSPKAQSSCHEGQSQVLNKYCVATSIVKASFSL